MVATPAGANPGSELDVAGATVDNELAQEVQILVFTTPDGVDVGDPDGTPNAPAATLPPTVGRAPLRQGQGHARAGHGRLVGVNAYDLLPAGTGSASAPAPPAPADVVHDRDPRPGDRGPRRT